MHVNSLASPFPILFLTSPCPYKLCFLIPAPFPPSSPFPFPANNPPNDLHIYGSVTVLLVCLGFFLDLVFDTCEFVTLLTLIVLIFLLNKSLTFYVIMAW